MLLGQLYYYDKQLDVWQKQHPDQLPELPGVLPDFAADISPIEKRRILRDSFSQKYLQLLQEENLTFASHFWQLLTSPKTTENLHIQSRSPFQEELIDWAQSGYEYHKLENLLQSGSLTPETEDFAIYYGLRVLYLLSLSQNPDPNQTSTPATQPIDPAGNPAVNPQIVVITQTETAPLFANLNCLCLQPAAKSEQTLIQVQTLLQNHPDIELLLVVLPHTEELTEFLQKYLDSKILVSSLNLAQSQQNTGFFDKLAKQTLGIRLT